MLTETAAMIVGYNKEMARQANKCQCKKEDKQYACFTKPKI